MEEHQTTGRPGDAPVSTVMNDARTDAQLHTAVATAALEAAVRAKGEVPNDRAGASRYIDERGVALRSLGFTYAGADDFERLKAVLLQVGVYKHKCTCQH